MAVWRYEKKRQSRDGFKDARPRTTVKGDFPLKVRTTILTVISIILCSSLTAWGTQSSDNKANVDYATLMKQGGAEYRSGHFAAAEKLYLAALRNLDRADERERAFTLTELGAIYVNR